MEFACGSSQINPRAERLTQKIFIHAWMKLEVLSRRKSVLLMVVPAFSEHDSRSAETGWLKDDSGIRIEQTKFTGALSL